MKRLLLVSAWLLLVGLGCQKRVGLSVRGGPEEVGASVIVNGQLLGKLGKVEEVWTTTSPQDTSEWGARPAARVGRLETPVTTGRLDAVVQSDRECNLLFVSLKGDSLHLTTALGDSAQVFVDFRSGHVTLVPIVKPSAYGDAEELDSEGEGEYHDELPSTVADTVAEPKRVIADSAGATPRKRQQAK